MGKELFQLDEIVAMTCHVSARMHQEVVDTKALELFVISASYFPRIVQEIWSGILSHTRREIRFFNEIAEYTLFVGKLAGDVAQVPASSRTFISLVRCPRRMLTSAPPHPCT
jgi:hypothetical protein